MPFQRLSKSFFAQIIRFVRPQLFVSLASLFLAALYMFAMVTNAQETKYTQNSADQMLRPTGRVNPSTLGMEMQIPLTGYPGRGVSIPINLSYSSKLWRLNRSDFERRRFLKDAILEKLDLLARVIKRNKLDTDIELLKADVAKVLS